MPELLDDSASSPVESAAGRRCLALLRVLLAGWLGAGLMFVALLMALRYAPYFTDDIKHDQLRVVFPVYYVGEFTALGLALLAGCGAQAWRSEGAASLSGTLRLLSILTVIAVIDYVWIYQPLAEMIRTQTLTLSFKPYHRVSIALNTLSLLLVAIAAWKAHLPQGSGSAA